MQTYPSLNTQVIGQAESALGAILDPLLAQTGTTFRQWLVLTVTAASGADIDRATLVARIAGARKIDGAEVETAIGELAAAGLARAASRVTLTEAGQATCTGIRAALEEITARLFDFPAEDLATAGRVLAIVTARANAELTALADIPVSAPRSRRSLLPSLYGGRSRYRWQQRNRPGDRAAACRRGRPRVLRLTPPGRCRAAGRSQLPAA
jgi:DNA-binding MarR family transcriptional regulator